MRKLVNLRVRFNTAARSRGASCAFTLIELLVSLAILVVLIALVLPMARQTIGAARGFKCQMNQKSVAYDFVVFADETLHGDRGDDARDLGGANRFRLETFLDSQYCVDEFWCWPGQTQREWPDPRGDDAMRCPEVRNSLTLRSNMPCASGAVSPPEHVSFGFNVRLNIRERFSPPGAGQIVLNSNILGQASANVPLMWDVNGAGAVANGVTPFFSGPSLDSPLVFAGSRYWFPGIRHNGGLNTAFIDGHVGSSRDPLNESSWRWEFVPDR